MGIARIVSIFSVAALLTMVHASFSQSPASAGPAITYTYIGPTPYLKAADSVFFESGFVFGECNEDFEDGTFDVPGATGNGSVASGGLADSVDADDGVIDGSGTNGHSYFQQDGGTGIVITFDEDRTNGYPTEVAITWTDGASGSPITFEAFGPDGSSFGAYGPFVHADLGNYGTTAEDRQYAVTNPAGVSKIRISNVVGGVEVDHLQLDHCVVCGDLTADMHVTATDALNALRTAVGITTCNLCACDVNSSGKTTTADALAILRKSVALNQALGCPACVYN